MIFFKLERGSPGEQVGFVIVVVVVGFLSPVEETLLRHRKGSTWYLRHQYFYDNFLGPGEYSVGTG